jgi:hypothetical protein
MTMRSIALFAHLVGMLALFAGLAVEWLCVERLRAPDEPGPPMFTVRVLERLPRVTGIAVALILLSGIPLAARIGVLRAAFVGVSPHHRQPASRTAQDAAEIGQPPPEQMYG